MSIWYRQSQFRSNFDLKNDQIQFIFYLNQKYIEIGQKWSKMTGFLINFDICDQIQSIFDIY